MSEPLTTSLLLIFLGVLTFLAGVVGSLVGSEADPEKPPKRAITYGQNRTIAIASIVCIVAGAAMAITGSAILAIGALPWLR